MSESFESIQWGQWYTQQFIVESMTACPPPRCAPPPLHMIVQSLHCPLISCAVSKAAAEGEEVRGREVGSCWSCGITTTQQ